MGQMVLQTDETIEPEFNAYFADRPCPIFVSLIPSGVEVTVDTLAEMEKALLAVADFIPKIRS